MYAAMSVRDEAVEATGADEDQIIRNLAEEHGVHYQVRPWTDEDIVAVDSSGWGPIDKMAKDHNEPYEIEIFEVPEGYRYGPDIANYFSELRQWPEPIKTVTLYKAVPGNEEE